MNTTDEIVAKCLAQCMKDAQAKVDKQRQERLAMLLAVGRIDTGIATYSGDAMPNLHPVKGKN